LARIPSRIPRAFHMSGFILSLLVFIQMALFIFYLLGYPQFQTWKAFLLGLTQCGCFIIAKGFDHLFL